MTKKKEIKRNKKNKNKEKKIKERRRKIKGMTPKKKRNGSPRKVIHHITICHIEKEIIDDFTLLWFNNVIVFDKQIYI